MLLPLKILKRVSASEPPVEKLIGVDPAGIVRVEDGREEGTVAVWCDGSSAPYFVKATVAEIIGAVNLLLGCNGEEKSCEPANSDTV